MRLEFALTFACDRCDDVDDAQWILGHIIGSKAQDVKTTPRQERGSQSVVGEAAIVRTSIDLDDEHCVHAGEVGDVGTDGTLAAELEVD